MTQQNRLNHKKRKTLGQHFLISSDVARRIVSAANLKNTETVFELGTGYGILTALLPQRAKYVISVDIDPTLVNHVKNILVKFKNLQLLCNNGFDAMQTNYLDHLNLDTIRPTCCDVFVSNLPYSRSRCAIEHLASANFGRCIIMIQKEFASKLFADISSVNLNSVNRRAISIIAQYCFDMRVVMSVSARCFKPPPKVDSVVVTLIRKNKLSRHQIQMINKLFSYRRKYISTILRIIHDEHIDNLNYQTSDQKKSIPTNAVLKSFVSDMLDKNIDMLRLDDLVSDDVVQLANALLLHTHQ